MTIKNDLLLRRLLTISAALIIAGGIAICFPDVPPIFKTPTERRAHLKRLTAEALAPYLGVPAITTTDAASLHQKNKVLFIDARPLPERAVAIIPGAISLAELETIMLANKHVITYTFVVYCTVGRRSAVVTKALRQRGLAAVNLRGGILAWVESGGIVVDTSGKPTKRVHVYAACWNVLPPDYTGFR